jgi:2-methylcitrate dehydratase PrpD
VTISGRLAELVVGTEPAALPEATRTATSMHTLDTLGCALAALGLDAVPYVRASYAERGVSGPASVVGQAGGLPADMAAMVNGALAHALDYDDTHAGSIVHVSAATVPAALAMGEHTGRSGAEVLTAIALGNEVSVRLGRPAGAALHARGFHPTGVCGVFGATATAARLAGADAEQTRNAFGIAGSMAGGLMEFLADGSETKPFHPGWAAHAAINAVWFALHGATGPATVVEGDRGFFGAYLRGEEPDLSSVTDGLGERWLTDEIAFKPYPACHYVHAPLDALSAILDEEHLGAGDIAEITAFTDETGVILVLEPAADKAAPRTAYDAKFSIPYAFGARVAHGAVGVETFTDQAIGDPDVLAVAAKVRYELRRYSDTGGSFGGGVRVVTTDGRVFENELRHQRGGAENPLTDADVAAKFTSNAAVALPSDEVARLAAFVLGMSDAPDLGPLAVLRAATVKGGGGLSSRGGGPPRPGPGR